MLRSRGGGAGTNAYSVTRSCASSRYPSTNSLETVGHPAKNSSIVKPLFKSSRRRRTGTRVPRKQGVPCINFGSTETISLRRALFAVLISLLQYLTFGPKAPQERRRVLTRFGARQTLERIPRGEPDRPGQTGDRPACPRGA